MPDLEGQYRRIIKGAAVLNEVVGPGWIDKVDLNRLVIMSHDRCVIAQVFENSFVDDDYTSRYNHGLLMIEKHIGSDMVSCNQHEHGFCEAWYDDPGELDRRWKRYIEYRRRKLQHVA